MRALRPNKLYYECRYCSEGWANNSRQICVACKEKEMCSCGTKINLNIQNMGAQCCGKCRKARSNSAMKWIDVATY